jgi:flagellar capping protein FliD
MESRLTRYQETLMAKYTAMETMITQLQSQMTWLNGQIDSLGK